MIGKLFTKATNGVPQPLITEPLTIVTGAMGAGKTLFAIQQADHLVRSGQAKRVFARNINNPDTRKLPPLPYALEDWHTEAQEGDVILIDECQKDFPVRGHGRPPKHVEEMAEARKRGVRFVLVTQDYNFDTFLKGKCNRHYHLERKTKTLSTLYEWPNAFKHDPANNHYARVEAEKTVWKQPKEYFDWYESAKAHYFRSRIPFRLYLVPLFVIAVIVIAWKLLGSLDAIKSGEVGKSMSAFGSDFATQATGVEPQGRPVKELTPEQQTIAWLEARIPRVQPFPWSAPIFDELPVQAQPELYCVGSGFRGYPSASCSCYTEQVTRIHVDQDMCWIIATNGIYNPHRPPIQATRNQHSQYQGGPTATHMGGAGARRPQPSQQFAREPIRAEYSPPGTLSPYYTAPAR